MTEMSMGMIERNEVRDAPGVGIFCNDHSMCMIEQNVVVGTRPDERLRRPVACRLTACSRATTPRRS